MVRAAVLALAMLLAGCGADERLQAENAALRQQLQQQQGARAAEIAELERRAAVAQACDYMLPMCPASMVAPGRKAIEAGYSGGGGLFWALVAAKLAALGAGLAAAVISVWLGYVRLVAPAEAEAEAARQLVAEAEQRAAKAKAAAEAWAEKARAAKVEAEAAKAEAEAAATAAKAAQAEAQAAKALRDAVTGL